MINGDQSGSTGDVTVASGATLGGSGTHGGAVIVAAGGDLAPGEGAIGTLAVNGTVTLDGDFEVEISGTDGGSSDLLEVTGDLDIDGATLNVTELVAADDASYTIATYTGALTGEFTIGSIPAGYQVVIDESGTVNEIRLENLNVAPVNTVPGAQSVDEDTCLLYTS